jgi:hypothetical protein
MEGETPRYITVDEFFDNPEPSTMSSDVRKARQEESDGELIDPSELRRRQDWAYLANRIVGAEHLGPITSWF